MPVTISDTDYILLSKAKNLIKALLNNYVTSFVWFDESIAEYEYLEEQEANRVASSNDLQIIASANIKPEDD